MLLLGKVALSMDHLMYQHSIKCGEYGLGMGHQELLIEIQFWQWNGCSKQSYHQ